jgi:hypothetical protein
MNYRKLLTLAICLLSVMQLLAQTLITTIPSSNYLAAFYYQIGFDNSEYLYSYNSDEAQISLVSTTTYSVEYTYSESGYDYFSASGIINDMDGNGHPELVVGGSNIEIIDGVIQYDLYTSIIDMGEGDVVFTRTFVGSATTTPISIGFFINGENIWCMMYYEIDEVSIYDLNMQASTTQIALYGTAKRSTDMSTVYPNPSNNGSRIQFNVSEPGPVSIVIYDNLGRIIYQKGNSFETAGLQAFDWSNSDTFGKPVPSGMYHVEIIQNGKRVLAKKITVLK